MKFEVHMNPGDVMNPARTRIRVVSALLVWLVVATAAGGCSGSATVSRSEVLADLARDTISPAYEHMATSARDLQHAAEALCEAVQSDASSDDALSRLDDTRDALSDSLAQWSFLEAMWVGPVMDRRSWSVIDWPVDTSEIETLIADDEPIDLDRLSFRIGADQRGLRAVDHILNSTTTTDSTTEDASTPTTDSTTEDASTPTTVSTPADSTPTTDSTTTDASTPTTEDASVGVISALHDRRRCEYLTGITRVIADEAELLHTDWAISWEGGPAYRDTWATSDDSDGIDDLVNGSLFLLEAIADRELGAVAGLMDDPTDMQADKMDTPALSVTDMRDHLRGLRAVLVGGTPSYDSSGNDSPGNDSPGDESPGNESSSGDSPGGDNPGLGPLLGAELVDRLEGLITDADTVLSDLPQRLEATTAHSQATTTYSPESITYARDAVKAIQIVVATEVVGLLGVAIGFSDADGDSSN